MSFILQLPDGISFADVIGDAAAGALNGGGVFAFATKAGVERFFAIPNVRRMLQAGGRLDLIVGTDAITNADALICIEEQCRRFPALHARAFVHDLPVIFHPKYCWFSRTNSFCVVTGSGNLTSSGLGADNGPPARVGNWEAFSIGDLQGTQARSAATLIHDWVTANSSSGRLLPLSHPNVLERAVANSRVKYINPHRQRQHDTRRSERGDLPLQAASLELSEVMIREIPLNRTGQADISQRGLSFFGFLGEQKKVLIQHISLDNVPDAPVERLLFVNASQNYRIEIREVAELEYKVANNDGRMILVAVKLDDSAYRYTIVPVDSEHYTALDNILGPIPTGRRLMRTSFTDTAQLKVRWPGAPSMLFPVTAISTEDVD
jgi:hypothetical protein